MRTHTHAVHIAAFEHVDTIHGFCIAQYGHNAGIQFCCIYNNTQRYSFEGKLRHELIFCVFTFYWVRLLLLLGFL
jgi:hypothetical protein